MLSKEEELNRNLTKIMPNATAIIDYKENGDGDAVLLCHKSLRIVERGVSGSGFAAWIKVNTRIGVVGVLCLHAPNESRKRKEVWAWMRPLISDGHWIILGDFNMVENQIDSIGPSPVIRGEEKNMWEVLTGSADLVDARACATTTKGPLFTRQAWYGNRFDQSRLDRFYLSGGGEWLYHIRAVEHQGARTLSDHVPIVLELVTTELLSGSRPRRSYFKMDCKAFGKEDVLEEAKEVWRAHPRWARDKRKRWALALGRIRKLLMEVRSEASRERLDMSLLEDKVEEARSRVQHDQSVEKPEVCLRKHKARQGRDDGLGECPDGRLLEDQDEMLKEVYNFYRDLYTAEEETEEMLNQRRRVVGRIDRGLSWDDNSVLEEVPSEELITTIVMEMPKEKSPGIDGVMVEILQIGWEFMREDCFLMVQSFWEKKELVGKDSRGIIKLIPKNDEKHLLKNWRPITLLTMTYKIVAKIIAVRLKGMLPKIIDTQQTGFVAGWNIIDNILSLRLGQEWAQVTSQHAIFVKLDFMKAYDRVAHGFLWETLLAMGMGTETLGRIKGLVEGGSSEVHINGSFTDTFKIERGVRQGCPLAPLLFSMTTQPLMRALREEERKGNIHGLNIGNGQTLLHQLFADDTGICITAEERQFENLKEVIKEFEGASGACLNLQKSVVMQLSPRQPPAWLNQTGCEVAEPGKCFKYLGVATSRDGLEELERLCRNFLWGWNEEGNPKHALIAWERIAQTKAQGGLGWATFKDMVDALYVRQVNRILVGATQGSCSGVAIFHPVSR
ncbi:hypothetical protein R1sor_008638 [Riccia sorocarpa]|uniref:Reverse transcriptase domain-containing protein n=1 Tax=Riccia sorocarpa TaxID=122646 RepID=A0ABD3HWT5_9MARC